MLTGLCGGLGRHFGIDPVIFRVAFVVLALAGGAGLLLYVAGWLLVPDDRSVAPAADRFLRDRGRQLVLAVMIGIGIVVLLGGWNHFQRGNFPLALALIGIGAVVLWSRRNGSHGGRGGPGSGGSGGPGAGGASTVTWSPIPEGAPPTPPPVSEPIGWPGPPPSSAAESAMSTTPMPAIGAVGAGSPPTAAPPRAPRPRREPKPKRPRSVLVPVTLSLLALLGGVLALVQAPLADSLAFALLLTAGALIVGTWRGRARLLIPVAMLLGLALAVASVLDVPISAETGDRLYRPTTSADLRPTYRLGIGQLTVDLSAVDFSGQDRSVLMTDGIGQLRVIVPATVQVVAIGHAGAGNVRVFGTDDGGSHINRTVVSPGTDGGGRLVVRARVGLGQVEVQRAAA